MPDFDIGALGAYLTRHVQALVLPLSASRFNGGQSNPTYKLTDAAGHPYVLRKKPAGRLLPSAHAIEREYRVMKALRGSAVPVPQMHCLCEDESIIGTPFYVMECVAGRIFWDPALPELEERERAAVYDDMNRVVAALHAIDPNAVGLGSFGKTGHFLQRQIDRWVRQYKASETEPIQAMDKLIDWLPRNLPPPRPNGIFHGDLRMDNMIFHPTQPKVVAVLDWELATLGDPLADLSYHAIPWYLTSAQFRGMAEKDMGALGIPDETSYVRQYCARVGRPEIPAEEWEFYRAYSLFRLAAILQGILKRALDGTASSSEAVATGSKSREIAECAWNQIRRDK